MNAATQAAWDAYKACLHAADLAAEYLLDGEDPYIRNLAGDAVAATWRAFDAIRRADPKEVHP